jgi:hypothetical protein
MASWGCGGKAPVKVSGVVTISGSPVVNAIVGFDPVDKQGLPASGQTDANGRFELTSRVPGDGVLPGEYKVTITAIQPLGDTSDPNKFLAASKDKPPDWKSPVHENYSNVEKTPLKFTVPIKGKLDIELNEAGK